MEERPDMRQVIALAQANEAATGRLANKLKTKVNSIQRNIALPEAEGVETLMRFINQYIEHVPRLVDALSEAAEQTEMLGEVAPLINFIEDFFIYGSNVPIEKRGLEELLDEAYLAHRLVEEVNDRYMVEAKAPLLTLDMTTANLIVHSLIGEPFANELDEVAMEASGAVMQNRRLTDSESFRRNAEEQRMRMWTEAWTHWSDVYELKNLELQMFR